MSPRTEKQFEKIRESKRELIMNTALEEFAENGYHVTSISKISKRANISKGLIYNYFKSKEDLLKSIIYRGLKIVAELFDPKGKDDVKEDDIEYMIGQLF